MGRRRCALGLLAVLVGSPALGAVAGPEAESCRPWAGEPAPLPRVNDPEPVRARWAELRAAELAREAGLAEGTASVESHRLWRRVLCLDPEREGARLGLERTRVVRLHRPEVGWGAPARVAGVDAWAALDLAVRVPHPRPAPPAPEAAALASAGELLDAADESLHGARFEEALGRALAARSALEDAGDGASVRVLRVRIEVSAATAQLALGDESGARESLARALVLEPDLALDPGVTSPKVLGALEAARSEKAEP